MSVNSKMTAIANPIRTLKGASGKMGLDAMASGLTDVVNECDTQADLIAQIKTALANKMAGGGVELPSLENPGSASDLLEGMEMIDQHGTPVTGSMPNLGYMNKTLDGVDTTIVSGGAGYYSGVSVSFDSSAVEALLNTI